MRRLEERLRRMDGRGYKAYKGLEGDYRYSGFDLRIDHVQGDPFAEPSRIRVFVAPEVAALPDSLWSTPVRRIAVEDFLGRAVAGAIRRHVRGDRGTGASGRFLIATSGQQVLARNAVLVSGRGVEVRMQVGLPAAGRRISAPDAIAMLTGELPRVVEESLRYGQLDQAALARHVASVEDQDALRRWLPEAGLVAFVGDGALLPRASGVDDRPLDPAQAVPFRAPDSMAREAVLPHAGRVRGMGVPRGVTLIVGGGFHGKSTLLDAIERGVYDHVPGDGRERVVTDPGAVKIRAEDGRAVTGVDISVFIDNLPLGRDTRCFSTGNASGSTSQAAAIVEALGTGAGTLLVDEDTSATNFMIRDAVMQALVSPAREPITPLVQRVRALHERLGVSTVLVSGGSGAYLAVADTVIMMDEYRVLDVTENARRLAGSVAALEVPEGDVPRPAPRRPRASTLAPEAGRGERVQARGTHHLRYGTREVDLHALEQLVDPGQTLAVGYLIRYYATHLATRGEALEPGLESALGHAGEQGLDALTPYVMGTLAVPRLQEVAAALNRFRGMELC